MHIRSFPTVVSVEDLLDAVSQDLGNQHSRPVLAVIVNYDLQLVLHHHGHVHPVLMEGLGGAACTP